MHPRNNFFSSLSRLEKRLKLETQAPQEPQETTPKPPQQQQQQQPGTTQTQSLGSPMYLYHSHPTSTSNPMSDLQETQPFFSNSIPQTPQHPEEVKETCEVDDIETLLQLLGLDDEEQSGGGCGVAEGEDEIFYGKIVGVKGPKSDKELERLNGWIKYLMNRDGDGGIKQPLRLAHLLLAKASYLHMDDHEFPPTVQEFLQYDPPVN